MYSAPVLTYRGRQWSRKIRKHGYGLQMKPGWQDIQSGGHRIDDLEYRLIA